MTRSTRTVCIAIACALAIPAAGCARSRQAREMQARQQHQQQQQAATMGGEQQGQLSDAEVAKVLETVNRGEVEQAQIAVRKADSDQVRDYAERMVDEHQRALERTDRVAQRMDEQPQSSRVEQDIASDSQQTLSKLEQAEGARFDDEYLGAQIETHRKVLELIDGVLLPSARDPQLRAEIEALRPVIPSHLDHAERLQQQGAQGG